MTVTWRDILTRDVTITAEVAGTAGVMNMGYLRLYMHGYRWIQCPSSNFVGNGGPRNIEESCHVEIRY